VEVSYIIKNDHEDWERELFKIAEIYENSFLTLGALQGNFCYSGFLAQPGGYPMN
jgi:hypothetical protein